MGHTVASRCEDRDLKEAVYQGVGVGLCCMRSCAMWQWISLEDCKMIVMQLRFCGCILPKHFPTASRMCQVQSC